MVYGYPLMDIYIITSYQCITLIKDGKVYILH